MPGSIENPKILQSHADFAIIRKQAISQRDVVAKRREPRARCLNPLFLLVSTSLCESSLLDRATTHFSDFQMGMVKTIF
jgi:hypothetical protein